MGKDLIKTDASDGFMIAGEDGKPRELMKDTFEQLGIDKYQLPRISIPTAGMTQFQIPTLEGEEMAPELMVIMVAIKGNEKAWWREEFSGGGAPPDCSSHDGQFGIGTNSLDPEAESGKWPCADCTWNQFESSRSGSKGKDCRDMAFLYFFREKSILPDLMIVPATSLKSVREYMTRLISNGKALAGVVTRFTLTKAQSQGGITYSQLALGYVRDLSEEESERISGVANAIKEVSRTAAIDVSDLNS